MPTQQLSAISWREQVNFQWDDDEVRFVLEHTLSWGEHANHRCGYIYISVDSKDSLIEKSACDFPVGIDTILTQWYFSLIHNITLSWEFNAAAYY
jgi:hypothetical protein